MVEYICSTCGKAFPRKSGYDDHLNKKNPCKKPKFIEEIDDTKYDLVIKKMTELEKKTNNLENENKELKKENKNLLKKLEHLTDKISYIEETIKKERLKTDNLECKKKKK